MYVEASDQIERRTVKTRDGTEYEVIEQAVGWFVPGEAFPVVVRLRVESPYPVGRYFPKGKPTFRPYEKVGDRSIGEALALERFSLEPLSEAQSRAIDDFMVAFRAASSSPQPKAVKAAS